MLKEAYVYFLLIFLVFATQIFCTFCIKDEKKKKIIFLVITLGFMYGLCAFRDVTVGVDTIPYLKMYTDIKKIPLTDFSSVYTEFGYSALMKVFAKVGIPFQGFLMFVYLIVFIPVGVFFYRNSKNVALSTLVYVCFIFFTFNLTGIRNSIALSIILVAYEFLKKKMNVFSIIMYVAIIGVACLFHRSAFIVAPLLFVSKTKMKVSYSFYAFIGLVLVFLYGRQTFTFLTTYVYAIGQPSVLSLGGLFVFVVFVEVCAIIFMIPNSLNDKIYSIFLKLDHKLFKDSIQSNVDPVGSEKKSEFDINHFSIICLYLAILFMILGSDANFSRIAMYFLIFITIMIPNMLDCVRSKSLRFIAYTGVIIFLVGFYYIYTLRIKQYNVVPYKFFFQ